jgi:hypothetical protein
MVALIPTSTSPPAASSHRSWVPAGALLCLLALGLAWELAAPKACQAQAAWEFTPYQVRIWIALPEDPTWSDTQFAQLAAVVQGRAESSFGPVWATIVERAPVELASTMRSQFADLKVEQVQAVVPKGEALDKIYLIEAHEIQGRLQVQVRELDYRARQFGVVVEREALQRAVLPWVIWDTIASIFTPIAKVERVDGQVIAARLRAGGLITSPESPAWIRPGDALRPVIRRNDRAGEPLKGGVYHVPWTMLEVQEQADALLTCRLFSGYRSPIPTKGGTRTERLALLVRPQFPATTLHLRSRDASKTPLVGYEVWRKLDDNNGELLGATDWRGNIELPQAEKGTLQTLLIRSGGQLLARLPLVPGQQPTMEVSVVNDDGRLQAEGFVVALQSKIMDLEARRQIVVARFRGKLKAGKLDEAQEMLDQFRMLESRNDLARLLNQQNIKSVDPVTQKRIEKLFTDARAVLFKFLDPELGNVLQRELVAAKAAPKAAPAAPKTAATPAAKTAAAPAAANPPASANSPMAPTPSATPASPPDKKAAAENPFE